MQYQTVDEYLLYSGLEEAHPELVRLLEVERRDHEEHIEVLLDELSTYHMGDGW